MDFNLRINNYDVDDRSAKDIMFQILLKIFESDVVTAIGSFHFWLDNIELRSPKVCGSHGDYGEKVDNKYELKIDLDAKQDKLKGLYVEIEEEAKKRIEKPILGPSNNEIKAAYYIEPGLSGVRKCANYIKSIDKDERSVLPYYLQDIDLNYCEFKIAVIWDMNKNERMMRDGVFQLIDYDQDYIGGSCDDSGCLFSFGNRLEEDFYIYNKSYYINRLNKIQQIFDEISPDKYEPWGEGEYFKLLKHGMLNRKGREYYTIDDKAYEEAIESYMIEKDQHLRKNLRRIEYMIENYEL